MVQYQKNRKISIYFDLIFTIDPQNVSKRLNGLKIRNQRLLLLYVRDKLL
jgi:hypothetical protein